MKTLPSRAQRVRFFECGSPDAAERLAALAASLRSQGASVEALLSSEKPGLRLLIARGGVGELESPAEVRQWRFKAVQP